MTTYTSWIFACCLPTVAVLTESLLPEHKTYVNDALSQNAFVIKTWTYRVSSLYVIVTKGNKTLLNAFFDGVSSNEQENRLLLEYNNSTKEVSVLLNNVTRGDEGVYHISTSIYTDEVSEIMDNTWKVQLNVLEPGEIKQGYAGENILITDVQDSIFFPRLYHNDQLISVVRGSDCDVSTNSRFYGRIRCSKAKDNNTTGIEIKNVTENDTGLYTVETEGSLTQRSFLNITGTYINSLSELIIVTTPDLFDGINSDQTSNITLPTTVISRAVVNQARLITYTTNSNVLIIATAPGSTNVINYRQPSNETLPTTVLSRSPVNPANSLGVPIYVIPVIIGTVGIINLIGCLIWGQRRKIHRTKPEKHNAQDECDPGLSLTPISLEPPLTVHTSHERKTGLLNIAQNKNIDQCTGSINMAQMISMDGYEVVDISINDDQETTPELEEIIYESTENCNTPYSDTSGYLTVLARSETTV